MHPILSAVIISGGGDAIHSLIYLLVIGIVLGILWYVIGIAPFLPAIFKTVLQWIVILFGAIIVINVLLGMTGHPIFQI